MNLFRTLGSALLVTSFVGCIEQMDDFGSNANQSDNYLKDAEKAGGQSQKWIYQGALPVLDAPSIFVSLKAHTVRVTGLLPADFDKQQLPFYALPSDDGGRTRITMVYPVATGASAPSTGQAPMAPGHYERLFGIPFTPTTDKASWGGFPFLKYHAKRGLAFHGPITSARNADTGDWEWILRRGPVSHGCQRMAGEHVVELSHVLGMGMDRPHKVSDKSTIEVPVEVSTEFDSYEGKFVDVDFPALPAVQRPKTNVAMFPTWDSRNLPNIVCAYDPAIPLDGHHCDNVGLVKQDVATGEMLVEEQDVLWIGSSCQSDSECGFKVDGVAAHCAMSGGDGYCTVACEGYCSDKEGASPTFCAATNDGGQCMAKAADENRGCVDIEGTSPKPVERFIGSSGAPTKVATVCSF